MKYTNNLTKILDYLHKIWPSKDINELCDEFGYKEHIKDLFYLNESEFKLKYPDEYKRILEFDKKKADYRTTFEAARDICANFLIEDLFIKPFNDKYSDYIKIDLNEYETRDIEKNATNTPDFIFRNLLDNKNLRFDLKIDWAGRSIHNKKFFFRGYEYKEYGDKYKAVAFIWCPIKNKYTIVDFREKVEGKVGIDVSKGCKEGFWADLSSYQFKDIFFNFEDGGIYLDNVIRDLCKLSKK